MCDQYKAISNNRVCMLRDVFFVRMKATPQQLIYSDKARRPQIRMKNINVLDTQLWFYHSEFSHTLAVSY